MTSRPRASQEEAGGDQQQQRKSKRRRSGPQSEKKDQEQAMELEASGDANGHGSITSYIGQRGLINRNEYLRLLQQSLAQLGFTKVAQQLENHSGVPRQSSTTSNLTECVLNGDWTGALEAVSSLDLLPKIDAHVPFLILEQKFLEIIEQGDALAALKCLRNDLTPLGVNTERLHELSRKLTSLNSCTSSDAAAAAAAAACVIEKTTTATTGRRKLLTSLQNIVPPGTLLPENRLEELVEQALAAQIDKCRLHNSLNPHISLLRNYSCGLEQLPLDCSQVLEAHTSEVWHLQFSHNGKMLATCGRDNKVILWDIIENEENGSGDGGGGDGGGSTRNGNSGSGDTSASPSALPPLNGTKNTITNGKAQSSSYQVRLRRLLSGHTAPVLFLAWSPDDTLLASCGQDSHVRLWNPTAATATSSCIRVLHHHSEPVLSASWLPDNKYLVTAGQDRMVAVVGIDGEVSQNWRAHRMQDVSVTAGGRYILASTHDRRINVYQSLIRPREIIALDLDEDDPRDKLKKRWIECQRQLIEVLGENPLAERIESTENKWLFSPRFDGQKQKDSTILEGEDLMAFSTSPCGRYLLANLRDGTLSLWDLGSGSNRTLKFPVGLVSRFTPPGNPEGSLGRFIVRSCLGGVGAKFIATGTESGKVPIWQRETGEMLAVLEGHTGVVNAVAWNPKRPDMMATASDDGTVRIWKASSSNSDNDNGV